MFRQTSFLCKVFTEFVTMLFLLYVLMSAPPGIDSKPVAGLPGKSLDLSVVENDSLPGCCLLWTVRSLFPILQFVFALPPKQDEI